jgi:hypothetical protein
MRFLPAPADMKRRSLLLGMIFLVSFLGACTPDQNETFIQGSWFYNDPHIQKQIGETFEETIWVFDRGTYETYSCCFAKFQQYGSYDIADSEGDKLTLELFNINGKFNSERVTIAIRIDREADTIRLLRAGPFTRMVP